ncbi:hypothetical protein [Thermus albus]|uniref:hypothetical protein n=1 Tax=Thermus albus TaxID=2908146 RepID=UPI001FAA8CC3|nr:hypothetical protein [Thermus albus]
MILYKKDPLSFSPPPVAPKSVVILGTLEANQPLSTTLGFYVRLKDPSACQDLGQAYLCPIGADDERAGEARFEESASAPLTLGGRNLTQGVAQGRFWLGLEVQGLPSQGGVFTLKDPKAMLTVGF